MTGLDLYLQSESRNPLNFVEELAELQKWDYDRLDGDQIVLVVEGQWRIFSLTLSWDHVFESLRLMCSFDLKPQQGKELELLRVFNLVNEQCWIGGFTLWSEHDLAVFRCNILFSDCTRTSNRFIEQIVNESVECCDRFYPAFQMVNIGHSVAGDAVNMAITEVAGNA